MSPRSYRTRLVKMEDTEEMEKSFSADGGFLTSNIFTLTVPQVTNFGSNSIRGFGDVFSSMWVDNSVSLEFVCL